ncbi:MAG: phosphate acyltransferase PlsX [Verrucomicrobia bacterium]|nr:phosphate acyltransferase PlsX [Verrucomicrobiota bacterium]
MQKQNEDLKRPRIGIDLLGCDTLPEQLLKSLINLPLEGSHPPKFTLFATEDVFSKVNVPEDFNCQVVTEVITMDEDPLSAVRRKKDSSILVGMKQLKKYEIDAFISAGNTGALLASATLSLPLLPGIDRPALVTLMPTKLEPVAVLDVGANVNVKAENLLQFAKMGIAYQKTRGIQHPTVGLLNIGEEKQKGTAELRKAYEILETLNQDAPFDAPIFIGNIEGRNVFHGNIDVLITDGFTGNVFLKTAEGIASFILDQLEKVKLVETIPQLKSMINPLRHRLHYAEYPGAILCGVEGIVIKCHGESTPEAFANSIRGASHLVRNFFLEKIKAELFQN